MKCCQNFWNFLYLLKTIIYEQRNLAPMPSFGIKDKMMKSGENCRLNFLLTAMKQMWVPLEKNVCAFVKNEAFLVIL